MRDDREIQRDWALFLDLDGTLLDIAQKPDSVVVPNDLALRLSSLRHELGGALAVVSGRSLDVLDTLLSPFNGPSAGEHGAVVRNAEGEIDSARSLMMPRAWVDAVHLAAEAWDGIVIERKPRSIVVHYRLAPERQEEVRALVEGLPGLDAEGFQVLPARMAFEVQPKTSSKGRAVALLMETKPFLGRTPVFVGDDVTDAEGMSMARKLGGFGLWVDEKFGGEPANVREWIARGVAA
jgi:trehalose 6-phosphate phosphatase